MSWNEDDEREATIEKLSADIEILKHERNEARKQLDNINAILSEADDPDDKWPDDMPAHEKVKQIIEYAHAGKLYFDNMLRIARKRQAVIERWVRAMVLAVKGGCFKDSAHSVTDAIIANNLDAIERSLGIKK